VPQNRQVKRLEILYVNKETREVLSRFYDYGVPISIKRKYKKRLVESMVDKVTIEIRVIKKFPAKDMPLWLKDFE